MQKGLFCSLHTVFLQEVGKFSFFTTCQAGDSRNWLYLIMARWAKLQHTSSWYSRNYGKIGTLVFPATWQFRILPDNSSICWYPADFWRTQEISRSILDIPEINQNKSSWAELYKKIAYWVCLKKIRSSMHKCFVVAWLNIYTLAHIGFIQPCFKYILCIK